MKNRILFTVFPVALLLAGPALAQAPSQIQLQNVILPQLVNAVNCTDGQQVMQESFNRIVSSIFTKLVPDITGDIKNGSAFTLNVNDDKTSASVLGTVPVPEHGRTYINVGARSAITNNVGDIFTGKDGLSTDWGLSVGGTWRWKSGLFFDGGGCQRFHAQRQQYIQSLCAEYIKYLDATKGGA